MLSLCTIIPSFLYNFSIRFIIYNNFIHIAVSCTVTRDVSNSVTHVIFSMTYNILMLLVHSV